MDNFTPAELLELILIANESLDAQFQYWLTISIAGIVATFIGGEYLTRKMRLTLAFLYLIASALFMLKYNVMLGWTAELAEGSDIIQGILASPFAQYVGLTRTILFVGGFIATVWFILTARQKDDT
jgi:hypothetical protein